MLPHDAIRRARAAWIENLKCISLIYIMELPDTPLCIGLVHNDIYISVPLQQELPIYHAEFLAILYACFYALHNDLSHVHIVSDNQAAIYTCRNLRGYTLPVYFMLAFYKAMMMFSRFTLSYITSETNPADAPSRPVG